MGFSPVHILLNREARKRLTALSLPFSKIDEMGAGMYKGKPKRMKQANSGDQPESGGQHRPMRSIISAVHNEPQSAQTKRSVSRNRKNPRHGRDESRDDCGTYLTSMPRRCESTTGKSWNQSKAKANATIGGALFNKARGGDYNCK